MRRVPPPLCLLWLLLSACAPAEPAAPDGPALWPRPDEAGAPAPPALFMARPFLLDESSWRDRGPRPGRHEPGTRGDFAVGNGSSFALLGYGQPAHRLHNVIGPSYQKDEGFFGDTWIELAAAPGGPALPVAAERTARVRKAAIVVSTVSAAPLSLHLVDFAPGGPGSAPGPTERALLRLLVLRNEGAESIAPELRVRFANAQSAEGQRLIETVGTRRRVSLLLGAEASAGPGGLSVRLPVLSPGQEQTLTLAHLFGFAAAEVEEALTAVRDAGAEALLASTYASWAAWADRGAVLDSPDVRVNDLVDGMKVTIRVQQARGGGVSEMSQYTKAWLRDTIGPVRFFLRAGYFAEVRDMLDYLYRASLVSGDLRNSYRLDLPTDAPPPPPDWERLPPLQGTVRSESPSLLILAHRDYLRFTSDRAFIAERFSFLKSCLLRQALEGGLLPFSGDETFRTAMSMAFGLPAAYAYEKKAYSANSAFLYVAAAEALAEMAEATGRPEEAAGLRERGRQVRAATDARYVREPEGFYAPFLDRESGEAAPRPFEDVATQVLWTGYGAPGEALADRNLAALVQALGGPGGFLQSAPAYNVLGPRGEAGVYTGMVPGFYLQNLGRARPPLAEAAFNALGQAASPSGNFGEYQYASDHTTVQLLYDESGARGDYTARLRSWEGGVNLDALLAYLTGLEPAPPGAGVRLSPQLPNRWPAYRLRNLRLGEERFDLEVQREGEEVRWRRTGPQ